MTVGRMEQEMSADEFTHWIAMNTLEPIGGHVADIRAAFPTLMLLNTVRRLFSEDAEALQLGDLVPWMPRPQPTTVTVLHSPDDPDYDPEAQAEAIRALLNAKASPTRH